jgi:succinyl-CoA synthetase beta subunit
MSFDPNAMFRQRTIEDLRDVEQEDPLEVEAGRHSLNYVKLDGEIGCMVNGAGLAMATLDIIALKGGRPANFMDVAGAATPERIAAALTLIHNDEDVRVILVNIFGGMMRCDSIAKGLVLASKELNLAKPLVVRLEGTNVEMGREILQQEGAGLPIVIAENLNDAAEAAVQKVGETA